MAGEQFAFWYITIFLIVFGVLCGLRIVTPANASLVANNLTKAA